MNLHAAMIWYDEQPTWLAGVVSSLSRIGVDHLVAVDGRFPHFNPGSPQSSRIDQYDAIVSAAHGVDIGVTLHRPPGSIMRDEVSKRAFAFSLVEAAADVFNDWVLVIDADEIVTDGTLELKSFLGGIDGEHAASCRLTTTTDPYQSPEADNGITDKTLEIYQKIPQDTAFHSLQSRFWRVMRNMTVFGTHYGYQGEDRSGVTFNLRPDIGSAHAKHLSNTSIANAAAYCTIEHRKNHRLAHRQMLKREYYELRDSLGLERA